MKKRSLNVPLQVFLFGVSVDFLEIDSLKQFAKLCDNQVAKDCVTEIILNRFGVSSPNNALGCYDNSYPPLLVLNLN